MVASHTELFLLKSVAPKLLNKKVKAAILFVYALFTVFSILSLLDVKTYYSIYLFVDEEFDHYDWIQMRLKYMDHVYRPVIYVELDETTDFYSEEAQF